MHQNIKINNKLAISVMTLGSLTSLRCENQ